MMRHVPAGAHERESATLLSHLRDVLARAGYTQTNVGRALGTTRPLGTISRFDLPLLEQRLAGVDDPRLAALVRFFVLGQAYRPDDLSWALAPLTIDALSRAGLVERDQEQAGQVRATVQLTPWEGLLLAHDPHDPADLPPDYVTGVTPASRTLASLTVRQPVRAALDLGTGCGIQALLAAQHAERVVATDLNPRALWFTTLNAQLNGAANIEVREGSLFEPVADQQFDLLVANPPYVISPETAHIYRDSGQPGDALSRQVVSQAPGFLREDGYATILCSWVCLSEDAWWEPLLPWLADAGCDAWLLHYETDTPLAYAAKWNEALRVSNPPAYAAALDRWCAAYQQWGVRAIATGAVVLRRRRGQNWVRWAEMPLGPRGSGSDQIQRVFAAHDYLATLQDDRALLGDVFALVDHHLDQRLAYRGGAYQPEHTWMALDEGVGVRGEVPPELVPLLFLFDGVRSLDALIADLAEDADPSREALTVLVLRLTRHLLEQGLLARVSAI